MESRPQPLEKCHRVIQHPLSEKNTLNGSVLSTCSKLIKEQQEQTFCKKKNTIYFL